jgi:hypothetical protein
MVIVLMISRHTAAECPFNNETVKKVGLELMAKLPELTKKHSVTVLGAWTIESEHLSVQVFEAATYEALLALSAEPAIKSVMDWNTSELKVAEPMAASMQRVMQT